MQAPSAQTSLLQRDEMTVPSSEHQEFVALLTSHQRLLFKVCWAHASNDHDRDDLFQEIVSRLWIAFSKYDRDRKFSTWMYRVSLNVAIDFRRRQQRRGRETRRLDEAPEPLSPASSADASHQEQLDILRDMLERQDDADRAILLLYLEGHSYRDIGEIIGISESNVGTRLTRLRKSLLELASTSNPG